MSVCLPDDIRRHLARNFAPEQRDEALRLLGEARIEDGSAASPRLLRCTVLASRGRLAELRGLVAMLALDWRDVVVAGEYECRGKALVPVRDCGQQLSVDTDLGTAR